MSLNLYAQYVRSLMLLSSSLVMKAWPPRSPDFTAVASYLKDMYERGLGVSSAKSITLAHLKRRIRDVVDSVIPDVFSRVCQGLKIRMRCVQSDDWTSHCTSLTRRLHCHRFCFVSFFISYS
jgi:hypothetical protein